MARAAVDGGYAARVIRRGRGTEGRRMRGERFEGKFDESNKEVWEECENEEREE